MNCGRCAGPMKEIQDIHYCTICRLTIDLPSGLCHFNVGPYYITLIDTFFDLDEQIPFDRTIITKGFKQIKLQQELPLDVNEIDLDRIWKHIRGE